MRDEPPRDQLHHVVHDRHRVSRAGVQLGAGERGQQGSGAAHPGVVVDDEDAVRGAPYVELDVLGAGGERVLVRLPGGGGGALGASAVGRDGGA